MDLAHQGGGVVCRYTDLVYGNSLDERILDSHGKKRHVVRDFLDLLKRDRERALAELEMRPPGAQRRICLCPD